MKLSMTLKQTQTLSPKMMQSMEILQMGAQELLEHIQELVQENPVLEAEPPPPGREVEGDLRRKLAWLEATDRQNRYYHRQDADEEGDLLANRVAVREDSLYHHLLAQLRGMKLDKATRGAAEYIIESLNSNGWLDEDIRAICRVLGLDGETVGRALEIVQSLDPAGVAARNLAECLSLQLHRRPGDHSLALRIVTQYLDPLSKNRYNLITKELGVPAAEVRRACDLIRSLNPRPATGFAARENLSYITPDVVVAAFSDHFELIANDTFLPTLRLSSYYRRLLKESDDREVKDYLSDKVRQAKWVVSSIEQRRSTLLSCARHMVEIQEDFFRRRGHLVPMSLADIAGRMGVHESTVSRAIKDKYLQCTAGVYPMNYFFSRGLGHPSAGASPDLAKAALRELIDGESPAKPLSDQKLAQLLAGRGIDISRRTVAKYRDELGIPPTTGRRKYE